MATLDELGAALKNAHAAGDVDAARKLAIAIQQRRLPQQEGDLAAFLQQQNATYGDLLSRGDEDPGFFENVASGFGAGYVGTGEMAALGAASLLEEEDELAARQKIMSVADAIRPEGGDQDSISYLVSSGLGSIAGALTPALIAAYAAPAAAATAIGTIGAGLIGIGAGAGEASERARAAGATEEERNIATARGAAIGSLEILPLGRILRIPGVSKFAEKIGGKAVEAGGSRIRSALTTGGVEAAQEAAAGFLQNLNERGYNAERELLDAGLIDEAIAGGGAGAILQAVVDTFTKGRVRGTETTDRVELGEVTPEEIEEPKLGDQRGFEGQGELFPGRATPTTVEQGPDYGSALTDFTGDEINAAVDILTEQGVEPASITEEMVFDLLTSEDAQRPMTTEEYLTLREQETGTPDMIAQAEDAQLAEMVQQEQAMAEDAELQELMGADEEAIAELERVKRASEAESTPSEARIVQDEKTARRSEVLDSVLTELSTGSRTNVEKRFSQELQRQNVASARNARPTKTERERIRRATDAYAGLRPADTAVAPQEVIDQVETTPEDTQIAELEARIPERQAAAPAEPSQMSFPGMGKRRDTRPETLPEQAPEPTIVTKEFLDDLGISPAAPIRKRTENKDLNDPDVREQFVKFANNPKISQQTRLNVARKLEGTPDEQLELFQPSGRGRRGAGETAAEPPADRASVPSIERPVGVGAVPPPSGVGAEPAAAPRGRGLAAAERGVGRPIGGESPDQLTLDIAPGAARAIERPLETRVTDEATLQQEIDAERQRIEARTGATPEQEAAPVEASQAKKPTKKAKPAAKPKATRKPTKETTEAKPVGPRVETGRTKEALGRDAKIATKIKDLWEQRAKPTVRAFAEAFKFEKTDPSTAGDKTAVLELLTTDVRNDKSASAAKIYFQKLPRPADVLAMLAHDIAFQPKDYRRAEGETDIEADFFKGTGGKNANLAREWVEANMSEQTIKWLNTQIADEAHAAYAQNLYTLTDNVAERRKTDKAAAKALEKAMVDGDIEFINELLMPQDSVLALSAPMHPVVRGLLTQGNLSAALRALSVTTQNQRVANTARKLAKVVESAGVEQERTQIEIVQNLKDSRGNAAGGLFDPKTNTIKLDSEAGINPHVLLHEVVHAATAATLANKNHPLTKQLTKLLEDVTPMLDSAYGATNVDEFVSEAMSSPEFQQKLAGMYPDGKEISAFQRFVNSVGNFVRKLVGMQPKSIESALTAADAMIEAIISPAPRHRDSADLPMASTRRGVEQEIKEIDNTQKGVGKLTAEFRQDFADSSEEFLRAGVGNNTKLVYLKLLGSQALGDVAKKVGLKDLGLRLHRLVEEQRGKMYEADEWVQKHVREVERWTKTAGAELNAKLNNLIYSREYGATIWQVDPTLSQAQARKKYGDTEVSGRKLFDIWKAQRADWDALGADGQRAYKLMQGMYKTQYERLRDVIYGRIDNAISDPEVAKKLKREVYAKLFDTSTLSVYFPLIREGSYKLEYSLKDSSVDRAEDAYVVEMFDTYAARKRAMDELKEDPNVVVSSIKTHDGDYGLSQFQAAPPTSFVGQTLQTLKANGVAEDVQAQILRLFVEALPETSFAKSLQRRKGTPGYIQDALHAMKTKGYDLGRQTARLEYSAKIQQLADEIFEAEPGDTGGPKTMVGRAVGEIPADMVKKELLTRAKFAMSGAGNKQLERVYKGANQLAFIYTIGFNVASALVNLSQVPLFVLPMLGGKYGYENTSAEIFKAMRLVTGSKIGADSSSMVGKALDRVTLAYGVDSYYDVTPNGDYNVRTDLDLDTDTIKELERIAPVVKLAAKRGLLSRSFLLDALGLEEGGRALRGGFAGRNMNRISAISAMAFNQAERFNRQATIIASYNLALEQIAADNPKMPKAQREAKAAEEALYTAQETNGGAVLETAPRVSQEGIGRVAFMYKSYGLQMYYTMMKTAKEMVEAHIEGDKATRQRAFKQVVGFHGTALFFSGVYGVPLYGAVQLMADLLFLDDDEDDFNTLVRKQIDEGWFKGPLQEALGINIADRVRLSGLLIQENRYNHNASLEEDIMYYIGGPSLSVFKRFLRGVDDLTSGDMQRGVESMLPAGVANAYKATFGRYQKDGGIYSRRGDPMYADMSTWEMMSQAIGFAPADYAFQQEQNQRDKRVERAILDERTNITRRYYVALRTGDFQARQAVLKDMREFNRKHPGARLDYEAIQRSLKSARKTSSEMYNGVTINPLVRKEIEESRREYDK